MSTFSFSVAPEISVPSQLYGVGPATDVTLSCRVQAYPSAINYWVKDQVSCPSVYVRPMMSPKWE